jgi:hypothetical protein
MDYFKDRIKLLKEESIENINKEFIDKLLDLIEDMAVMLDDCVDAVDELDEKVIEIEQLGE